MIGEVVVTSTCAVLPQCYNVSVVWTLLCTPALGGETVDASLPVALPINEVVGMGGAGIGLARGATGLLYHPASAAWRRPEDTGHVGVSSALSLMRVGAEEPVDLSNTAIDGEQWSGWLLGMGGAGFAGRVGAGLSASALQYGHDTTRVRIGDGHAALSVLSVDGHAAAGAGVRMLLVEVNTAGESGWYEGMGAELGAVFSQPSHGWNIGGVVRSPVRASVRESALEIDTVALPWQVALGIAWTSRSARHPTQRPLRLAADLVVDGPVRDGVTLEPLLHGEIVPRGQGLSYSPRLGGELEVWPERIRLRGGGYIEPARSAAATARAHGTAGFEVKLFHLTLPWGLLDNDLTWEGAVDVADRYTQFSWIGIGLWHQGVVGGQAATQASPGESTIR